MSAERVIASHLRLARDACDGAALLLAAGNRNAVYLAEQAVEQMMLAVAQAEGVHFARSTQHQLDTMLRLIPSENSAVADLAKLTWLEAYATTYRYPRTQGGITAPPLNEKLEEALTLASSLLQRLASHFAVHLDGKDEPAGNSLPPRKRLTP